MLVRPLAIPGLPIPRYLENALLVRTGRTRTPFPSLSNSNLSPRPHPQYAAHFTRHSDLTFASDSCPLLHIHPAIPYFLTLSLLRAFDAYEALRGGYEGVCPPRGAARTASGCPADWISRNIPECVSVGLVECSEYALNTVHRQHVLEVALTKALDIEICRYAEA